MTDQSNGELVTKQMGMPFGTQQPLGAFGGDNSWQHSSKNNPSKKRFTSYDRSDATGLDYAVNRFYQSAQGRFTQVDPIGMSAVSLSDPQSLNMYSYCGNDPINYVDPDGLFFKKLFGWIGKAFKWIAIAAVIAIAVLTVVPGAWAGTVLAKIGIWAGKHQILASLLGIHSPQWAIVNIASTAGATAAGFWVMAGVGAVNGFLSQSDKLKKAAKTRSIRKRIAEIAAKNIDEKAWLTSATRKSTGDGQTYGEDVYKCKVFVSDVIKRAGAGVPLSNHGKGPFSATAGEWGNKNVTDLYGWVIVPEGQPIEPGDVIAVARANPEPGVTGHVAIVGPSGKTTIGTYSRGVLNWLFGESGIIKETDWGIGRNTEGRVVRRWCGND